MEHQELIDKITKEVMAKLKEQIGSSISAKTTSVTSGSAGMMSQSELAGYIDHTLLKPEAVAAQFDQLCEEALKYRFMSVCVNSGWVSYVAKKLRGSGIKVCSVIGFPLGAMDSRSKAIEARGAIENGAHELDMVINVGALRSGDLKLVEEDIRAVKRACRSTTVLKVILETSFLSDDEIVVACEISKRVGAEFVKTSTGFSSAGATVEHIALMRRTVGPDMGVKASGGISTWDKALAMIQAGANRLGCGASVAVVTGKSTTEKY
jgi:deoxyribose-phosphate aldolase